MGVFSGPKINGVSSMSVSIDMANVKSYTGTGTTVTSQVSTSTNELTNKKSFYDVYDLTTTEFVIPTAPATALPSFSSTNNGTLVFDGVGNYLSFGVPSFGTTVTVEVWAKLGAAYSGNMMIGFETYNIWCFNGGLGFNTSNSDLYGISSATASSIPLVDSWRHYVFEMRTDVSYTNNKMYIDAVSQTLSQQAGSELAANRKFGTNYGTIASWNNVPGYEMPMTFGSVRLYNRALTAEEVTSNYYAGRNRFV